MALVIILIIIFIIIPILALLLLVYLARKFYDRGYKKLAIFIPFLIMMFVGYEEYRAHYPNDNFYVEDFEKYSGMKFPASGKIIEKEATYPDLHGHFMSMALIRVSEADYLGLKNELNLNRSAKLDTTRHPFYGNTIEFIDGPKHMEMQDFDSVYEIRDLKNIMVVGFCRDGKTVFYQKGI